MASCSLAGALNVKFLSNYSDINTTKCTRLETLNEIKCGRLETSHGKRGIRLEPMYFGAGLMGRTWRSTNPFIVSCGSSSQTANQSEDVSNEKKSVKSKSQSIPNSSEVQSLLTSICDTTSIAEFKLNLGGFRLYVKRDLFGENAPPLSPSPSPTIHMDTSHQIPDSNGSATTASLGISKPEPSVGRIQRFLDPASDEGLVILQSPKVGFFRRSRTIKGKRAPPSCKEKQEVKEGQVLCYIEQLGGEIPIESDVSGEVIKVLRDDGEPVGYGDALIAILPSFPGIKKLL